MTEQEAVKELEKVINKWLDFDYWAYLQLEMRGEWSQERMAEVLKNHERAEKRFAEFQAENIARQSEMEAAGATPEEIDAYDRTTWDERNRLVTAWRSLEGLPE